MFLSNKKIPVQRFPLVKYERLIKKISFEFSRKSGLHYEDIESQAYLIFCEATHDYDPSKKCKFSTWLYIKLQQGLVRFVMKEKKHFKFICEQTKEQIKDTKKHIYHNLEQRFMESYHSFSDEARLIVKVILNAPDELVESFVTKSKTKKALLNWITAQYGLNIKKVNYAFNEIKSSLLY